MDELFEVEGEDLEFYNGSYEGEDLDYDDEVDDAFEM